MSETTSSMKKQTLPKGFHLGNQCVRHFISADPLGDRYAIVFGSTNHVYDVNVSRGGEGGPRLADYQQFLKRVEKLRHPCLIPYFACGENEGIAWIRSEHADGVPDWVTTSVDATPPDASGKSVDGETEEICFPTLRTLLDSSGGRITAKDRNIIIGDMAEALAYLHTNGCHAGRLTPETLCLDRTYRHTSLIARIRFYAWPEETTPALMTEDLRQASAIITLLLAASESTKGAKLNRALASLAAEITQPGTYADGKEFFDELCGRLEDNGEYHKSKVERKPDGSAVPPDDHAAPSSAAPSVAASVRRHRSSHHRHKKRNRPTLNTTSGTGQIVASALRMALMFAGIAGVGIGVFFTMKYVDSRRRASTLITGSQRYSAISIIEDEKEKVDLSNLPANVLEYTDEQLKSASARGDSIATARLAVNVLQQNPEDPDIRAKASEILAPQLSRLEVVSLSDPAASYWLGYVKLLGLGEKSNPAEAIDKLEHALEGGYVNAGILLGDWFANRNSTPVATDDLKAMQYWRTAFGNPTAWTRIQSDAIARIVKFAREKRGLKTDDPDLVSIINQSAEAGCIDAMMLLSELYNEGRIVELSPSTSLSWLRRVTSNSTAPTDILAEAQRRMADQFADGRGTPPSLSAARIWYERAAKNGNTKAMETLAEFCESGKGDEYGKRNYDEAHYWRDQVAKAPPPPPTPSIFLLLPKPPTLVPPPAEAKQTPSTPPLSAP